MIAAAAFSPRGNSTMKKVLAAPQFSSFVTDWHLAPVLVSGDFAFLSGVTGVHADLSFSPEPENQFRDAFRFLAANLQAAGLDLGDIVEMTSYHVGLRKHLPTFTKVKDEFILEPYPAWTAVGVIELITEGTLVELRAVARLST